MSLDHKIDQIEKIESNVPSVRTSADMIIIYDNPEPNEIGSEFCFHGHTLVPFASDFRREEQLKNESVLKDLEFALQLIDESGTKKKFQKNYGDEITALNAVFSELQKMVTSLPRFFKPTTVELERLNILLLQLTEYIDRNKHSTLIIHNQKGVEEQRTVITNLQKIQAIVSRLEKINPKYSAYLLNPNEHNENLLKPSLLTLKDTIEDVISDLSLYEKLRAFGFDLLNQKETSSLIEVEDKMEKIIKCIFPAFELVQDDLEKKIKQTKRLIRSLEAQKQDGSTQFRELQEFERKLKGILPLFGNDVLNSIRENIKQKKFELKNEENTRKQKEIGSVLSTLEIQLNNRLIEHYVNLFHKNLHSSEDVPSLNDSLHRLGSQFQEMVRSKSQKVKELQKQVAKNVVMLGLPETNASIDVLANVRYEEIYIPVEVAPGQNLYMNTWSSENDKIKIPGLGKKLPKQIITANCMLSGSLEGITRKGDRFQLIDHNLDVCLTDVSGLKIEDIIHDPNLSPYEISMFIQFEHELQWINNLYGDQPKPIVRYHLPGADYMLSGLRYALSSDITLTELAKYCKAVKERRMAHENAIFQIAANAGISVIIESPLDNLGDMYAFIRKNIGIVVCPSLDDESTTVSPEENLVDLILQTLRDNNLGSVHQCAWATVLPTDIVAARQNSEWCDKLPKTIKDLLYLANSMEFAFASIDCNKGVEAADTPSKEDFNVLALHSTDESPIAKNCIDPKFNLVEKFGHFMAVFVQPRELYDGGAKSNNPFRMDLATANAVRREFLAEVIRKRNPSAVLQSIIRSDIHQLKEQHQPVQKKPDVLPTPIVDKPTAININPSAPGSSGMFAARTENPAPLARETVFQPTPVVYVQQ